MRVRQRRRAAVAVGAALLLAAAGPQAVADGSAGTAREGPQRGAPPAGDRGALVLVLDSSASMAGDDGTGRTRLESARQAVGTAVATLPAGHPTGLRIHGAEPAGDCTGTRELVPVHPLGKAGLTRALRSLEPRGDSAVGTALERAAQDLPAAVGRASGTRTIVLVSDGRDGCGLPPCEAARKVARGTPGVRIDAIGFQVGGAARAELECVAAAGAGRYRDAPDAGALARELQRSAQLAADSYRLRGTPVSGSVSGDRAPGLAPGQYLDSLGPGERRHYSLRLDGVSTATLSATAVPHPGAAADPGAGLRTRLLRDGSARGAEEGEGSACATGAESFAQAEGAVPLTSAVARVPSRRGAGRCDDAGRYLLVVERTGEDGQGGAPWPLELAYTLEEPPDEDAAPPPVGDGGEAALPASAELPHGEPVEVRGGSGFNDAREIGPGVWRDGLLPSQTVWYRVAVGWGQRLRYSVEFTGEPVVEGWSGKHSYGATRVYTPTRVPVGEADGRTRRTAYAGRSASLDMATVPVAWANRYGSGAHVGPVHTSGGFYIAVTLGAGAAEIADDPRVGVVLRLSVIGERRDGAGPGAPAADGGGPADPAADGTPVDRGREAPPRADNAHDSGAGWSGMALAALAGAATVLLVRRRRAAAERAPAVCRAAEAVGAAGDGAATVADPSDARRRA
ncbi:VWA domain-containing protein [Streptomyces sp. C10-9-1]|uniref:VWA domain-containing protein n=1 Tax=Streptomyces sp. C10-9-1 TaxID=1859285 RepID=UPI002112EBD7|nr:VWA domain-containing protein [Streptomyces sp. C10-9-1]MCQ6552136.1 VWA domain-containing protein [Streptomyces sp. C10-9-1]